MSPENGSAWLVAIGKRLRGEYDAVAEPLPLRLAELIKQLEMLERENSQKLQTPA